MFCHIFTSLLPAPLTSYNSIKNYSHYTGEEEGHTENHPLPPDCVCPSARWERPRFLTSTQVMPPAPPSAMGRRFVAKQKKQLSFSQALSCCRVRGQSLQDWLCRTNRTNTQ